MSKKLTLVDRRKLFNALPASKRDAIKKFAIQQYQAGSGFTDVMKKIGSAFSEIAKIVGPSILKEVVLPAIKSQLGFGLKTPGSGLKLAGVRGRGKKTKRKNK